MTTTVANLREIALTGSESTITMPLETVVTESFQPEEITREYAWDLNFASIPDVFENGIQWVPYCVERITPLMVNKKKGTREFKLADLKAKCTVHYLRADSHVGRLVLAERNL